jgi:hypothetical protein
MPSLSYAGWCFGTAGVSLGVVYLAARILRRRGYGPTLDALAARMLRAHYYWRPIGTIWRRHASAS